MLLASLCSTLRGWAPFCPSALEPTALRLASSTAFTGGPDWRSSLAPRLPPDLPEAVDFEVKQAEFVTSSSAMKHLPFAMGPEFAFIGQSNAGKSSLVNLLTRDPKLAKVSKKPGHTRTINHFLINRKWMLVDCPGYGDAKVSKQERLVWHEFTKEYFVGRPSLAQIFLLVDASRRLSQDDISAAMWINDSGCPWSLVFTKLDVTTQGVHPVDTIQQYLAAVEKLSSLSPPYVPTSAASGLGREALLKYIASLRQSFKMPLIFRK